MSLDAGTCIYAKMRVHIDQSRSDPPALCVDHLCAFVFCGDSRVTDILNPAIGDQQTAVVDALAGAGQDGCIDNQDRVRRNG